MPPRPGINRPLRSKKPGSAITGTQLGSYNSAQKAREGSQTKLRENSGTRNVAGLVDKYGNKISSSRETL